MCDMGIQIDRDCNGHCARDRRNIHLITMGEMGSVSDGYHTFDELYKHRCLLYIALLKSLWVLHDFNCAPFQIQDAKFYRFHHYEGWFCLGVIIEGIGQISYHLPEYLWETCSFAKEEQWEFDGHSSEDVLARLAKLVGML